MTVPNVSISASVSEYTNVIGLNSYPLLGAITGHFRFRELYNDGDSFDYHISDGPNFEIVTGTLTYGDPDSLSRDIILASSNGGTFVNWSGATRPLISAVNISGNTTKEWFVSFSFGGTFSDMNTSPFDDRYEIFSVQSPSGTDYVLYNFLDSATPGCEVAPTVNVNMPLQVVLSDNSYTSYGYFRILAGQILGSYTVNSINVDSGDRLRLVAESNVDTTIAGIYGTISATRANY